MPSLSRRAIGLDIGGTKIAGGVVNADGTVLERLSPIETPSSEQTAILETLYELIDKLRARHSGICAVGIGAAGLIDWPEGYVRWAPNNAYRQLPLRELVEQAIELPVVVDNDANVAAWAEKCSGAKSTHMAFLTVGTGVGGGLVLNGELYRGKTGIAAEVGHMVVDPRGGYRCGCGNIGCLEAVASGSALGRYGREAAAADPDGLLAQLAGDPQRVTGRTVHEAALRSDQTAIQLFERVGFWLGVGAASLVNLFDFDLIVIGGGLVDAGELLLGPIRKTFDQFLFAAEHRKPPQIVAAELGSDAGWIGAGLLALARSTDRQPAQA